MVIRPRNTLRGLTAKALASLTSTNGRHATVFSSRSPLEILPFYTSLVVFFTAIFYVSLFAPLVLLLILWKKLTPRAGDRITVATAIVVSLSYGYLMASLIFRSVFLGGDYSDRLFATVEVNTAITFVLFVVALIRKSAMRALLACSAF